MDHSDSQHGLPLTMSWIPAGHRSDFAREQAPLPHE